MDSFTIKGKLNKRILSQIIGIALILLWTKPTASFCYQANNIGQPDRI